MKRQRGFATIIVVVVAALAVAAIGYVLLARTGAVPSVPGLAGVTLNDKCKYNDKDLCKFLNNFKGSSNYTVVGATTAKDGQKSSYTFKLSGDDKFQNTLSTNGKESYSTIVIGDTTYTKDYSDNKWVKTTATKDDKAVKDDVTFNDNVDETPAKPEDEVKYTKIGTETCGKLTCFKYQVITSGADDTEYLWFDNKDYLLRKTEISFDGSVTTSDYNYDKVSITAPSPTKDPVAASGAAPTQAEIEAAARAAGVDLSGSAAASDDASTDTNE